MRNLVSPLLICLFVFQSEGQINQDSIQKYVQANFRNVSLLYPREVAEFYKVYNNNKYVWLNNHKNLQVLNVFLNKSDELGFSILDQYEIAFLRDSAGRSGSPIDSLSADIYITDVAVHFLHELIYGNEPPFLGYNGLEYVPACVNIPGVLAKTLSKQNAIELIQEMEPRTGGYISLKQRLFFFNHQIRDGSFSEVMITSAEISENNKGLISRLYQLGMISGTNQSFNLAELQEKVKECQRMFNMKEDGKLNPATREALNVSLRFRIDELKSSLNTLRWLHCLDAAGKIILVNIPSANLLLFDSGRISMQSRVVVGKRTTRTPILASRITDLILYPYWVVPKKIATRELLPSIKRNYRFLEDNNLQVLDLNGYIVDPAKINWKSLTAANFPYELRQSTGCDNSLGLIKFNFYSPYGVYLHDTPMKNLFNANRRYFSHGCIRVEKAMELAHILLKENTDRMDRILEKGCLPNQPPISIPLPVKVPVFVLYNTAWFDSSGNLQFNSDIYKKLKNTEIFE